VVSVTFQNNAHKGVKVRVRWEFSVRKFFSYSPSSPHMEKLEFNEKFSVDFYINDLSQNEE